MSQSGVFVTPAALATRAAFVPAYPLAARPSTPPALPRRRLATTTRALPAFLSPVSALAASLRAALAAAPPAALVGLAVVAVVAATLVIKRELDSPARTYDPENPNVGDEYDRWTDEGILEYYWGEHIHLGVYSAEERNRPWGGYLRKARPHSERQHPLDALDNPSGRAPHRPPFVLPDPPGLHPGQAGLCR